MISFDEHQYNTVILICKFMLRAEGKTRVPGKISLYDQISPYLGAASTSDNLRNVFFTGEEKSKKLSAASFDYFQEKYSEILHSNTSRLATTEVEKCESLFNELVISLGKQDFPEKSKMNEHVPLHIKTAFEAKKWTVTFRDNEELEEQKLEFSYFVKNRTKVFLQTKSYLIQHEGVAVYNTQFRHLKIEVYAPRENFYCSIFILTGNEFRISRHYSGFLSYQIGEDSVSMIPIILSENGYNHLLEYHNSSDPFHQTAKKIFGVDDFENKDKLPHQILHFFYRSVFSPTLTIEEINAPRSQKSLLKNEKQNRPLTGKYLGYYSGLDITDNLPKLDHSFWLKFFEADGLKCVYQPSSYRELEENYIPPPPPDRFSLFGEGIINEKLTTCSVHLINDSFPARNKFLMLHLPSLSNEIEVIFGIESWIDGTTGAAEFRRLILVRQGLKENNLKIMLRLIKTWDKIAAKSVTLLPENIKNEVSQLAHLENVTMFEMMKYSFKDYLGS